MAEVDGANRQGIVTDERYLKHTVRPVGLPEDLTTD